VHQDKIEKSKDHNSVPETMTFYTEVNSPASFNNIHPEKKENPTYSIQIYKSKPGIEE
jgi:hypothetical protein